MSEGTYKSESIETLPFFISDTLIYLYPVFSVVSVLPAGILFPPNTDATSPSLTHFHPSRISNGTSSSAISGRGFSFLILPS